MERILAIDPGYDRLGIAVIDRGAGGKHFLRYSSCITTDKSRSFPERLTEALTAVEAVIDREEPQVLAIENLFLSNNQKTAMRVAEVRGALMYLAAKRSLAVFEYNPLQIKQAITGHGGSDKKAMMAMIPHLVAIEKAPRLDDEFDAIAIGLTHLALAKPHYPQGA